MGSGGETKITNIPGLPSTITPHNYIFLPGNAELQGWARSSARIEHRAFNDFGRDPGVAGSKPAGPVKMFT